METFLAERIVSLTWRLRRAERLQNEVFDSLLAQELKESMRAFLDELSPKDEERLRRDPGTDPTYAVGRMIAKDYLNAMVLDRLQMYERRIEHSLCRIIKELRTLRLEPRLKGGDDAARGAADSSVRTKGFGEGCIPSEPDHRFAETQNVASLRLDDATRAGGELVSDCAKQTQSPASQEEHRPVETQNLASLRLDAATHASGREVAGDCAEQSQLTDDASCETNPISGDRDNGTLKIE